MISYLSNIMQMERMFKQMHPKTVQISQTAVRVAPAKNLWIEQVCIGVLLASMDIIPIYTHVCTHTCTHTHTHTYAHMHIHTHTHSMHTLE